MKKSMLQIFFRPFAAGNTLLCGLNLLTYDITMHVVQHLHDKIMILPLHTLTHSLQSSTNSSNPDEKHKLYLTTTHQNNQATSPSINILKHH